MEFISVGKIAKYVAKPVACRVNCLIHFKKNLENLKKNIENLEDARGRVQHNVDDDERKGKKIHDDVKKWLKEVDEIIEKSNNLLSQAFQVKAQCLLRPCPNLKPYCFLGREAIDLVQKTVELQKRGEFTSVSYDVPAQQIWRTTTVRYENFESRFSIVKEIMEELRNPNTNKVGVYGLGGVGKTTLVKEIAKQVKERNLFYEVIMATVGSGKNFDLKRIQGEIADRLGLLFKEETVAGRADHLRERISDVKEKHKKILIILDDVCEGFALEDVGLSLEECKILLTSRQRGVLAFEMGTDKEFLLEVLDDEETWRLFEKNAGDVVKDSNIRTIATQVAKNCGGLPILVVTVASALKNKSSEREWRYALGSLRKFDKEGITRKAFMALEWSYSQLDDSEAKSLFLLCAIIMKRTTFLNDVLKYAVGLGLFKDVNTVEKARDRMHYLVDKLKGYCLLQEADGNATRVKTHDLVYDVAISIASQEWHALIKARGDELMEWPENEFLKQCTMISLQDVKIPTLPRVLECPKLKLLHLETDNDLLEIPLNFFEETKELKTLDLSEWRILSLPSSLCSLTNLQTLRLHGCVLGDITVIGDMCSLEILSFVNSKIKILPKELGKLTRLRMLDLHNCSELEVIAPNVLSSLTRLEELNMENSFNQWEDARSIGERYNASPLELNSLIRLTKLSVHILDANNIPTNLFSRNKLESYKVLIGDGWVWNSVKGTSKTLKLKFTSRNQLDCDLKVLLKNSESLYLDLSDGAKDIVHHLESDGFPLLKHLHVQNNNGIASIVNSSYAGYASVVFPVLESLSLCNLASLENVCNRKLAAGSFEKLRSIQVKKCHRLNNLFPSSAARCFLQLQELIILDCEIMKDIVGQGLESCVDEVIDSIEFNQLRSLTLGGVPGFRFSSEGSLPVVSTSMAGVGSKEIIAEVGSHNLKQFFKRKVAFPSLEFLELSAIPSDKLWPDQLPERSCWNHNLITLTVAHCHGLRFLLSSSMARRLVQLKHLVVLNCQNMEEIVSTKQCAEGTIDGIFCELEMLKLMDLPNLLSFYTRDYIKLPSSVNYTAASKEIELIDLKKNLCPDTKCCLFNEKVKFPSLISLSISNLKKLTAIWHNQVATDSFPRLSSVKIYDCNNVHALVEKQPCDTYAIELKSHDLFHYLEQLEIKRCENMKYVLPAFMAISFQNLQELILENCGKLEEIVAKDGLEMKLVFEFPKVKFLKLLYLWKLTCFYQGVYASKWPSLKHLKLLGCDKVEILAAQCSSIEEYSALEAPYIPIKQALFLIEKDSFCSLQKVSLRIGMDLFDSPSLTEKYFSKVKQVNLDFNNISSNTVIFSKSLQYLQSNIEGLAMARVSFEESFICGEKHEVIGILSRLKSMGIMDMPFQTQLCMSKSQSLTPYIRDLEFLWVVRCGRLKNIMSSAISFRRLKYLCVIGCHGLTSLVTHSVAKNLNQLKRMVVRNCRRLTVILGGDKDDGEDEGNEIVLSQLQILQLHSLPSLIGFCMGNYTVKFPSLNSLLVTDCIELKISDGILPSDSKSEHELIIEAANDHYDVTIFDPEYDVFLDDYRTMCDIGREVIAVC